LEERRDEEERDEDEAKEGEEKRSMRRITTFFCHLDGLMLSLQVKIRSIVHPSICGGLDIELSSGSNYPFAVIA